MQWTEIKIYVPVCYLEQAEAIANMTVPYGIYTEDYSNLEQQVLEIAHIDLIDEQLLQKDRNTAVIHIYISPQENPAEAVSFLTARLQSEQIPFELEKGKIKEQDWANTWKQFYKPMRIGTRLVVCPSWESYDKQEGDVMLTLDPGMAFGTGSHETTRLCLELMQAYDLCGKQVLDVGCGSGILGISAVLLGAEQTIGCDIDALAVKVASENAKINGVSSKAQFLQTSLTDGISGRFDMIFANIVADVINHLCPQVQRFLKPGGIFIASGIIDLRKKEVLENAQKAGLKLLRQQDCRGWTAFVATI